MYFLGWLVTLIGLLCLLNLALMLGVIRRLREHSARISSGISAQPDPMLSVGEMVDEFTTTTVDGEPVSRDLLTGQTIVGFFDPDCELCHEHLPGFIAEAGASGRERALAVVRGSGDDATEMVALLTPAARVVTEQRRGPVARAFHVKAMPSFCRLDESHVIRAVGYEPGGKIAVVG
jgi:hypothetical protein